MLPTFDGTFRINVQRQEALPKAIQALLKANLGDGNDLPREVRHNCRIANDADNACDAGIVDNDGHVWVRNPKQKAQFGRTPDKAPYLTVCLVRPDTGDKVSARWEGETNFPKRVQRVAVHHDIGKKVAATSINLDWDRARIRASVSGGTTEAKRKYKAQLKASRREGKPRQYGRLCEADLR